MHCTPCDSSRCWRHLEPRSHRLRQIPTPPGPDPLLWRAALLLLVAAVIGGSTAGTLHWLGGDPDLVDRVVPLALAVFYAAQLTVLWRHPWRVDAVLWSGIGVS